MLACRQIALVALFLLGCGDTPEYPIDAGQGDAAPDGGGDPEGSLAAINIDGLFDDWAGVPVAYDDALDDGRPGREDLGKIWLAHDQRFLFVRFEAGREIDLNEGTSLRFYLDTDADVLTGLRVAGIGAEIEWRPGELYGLLHTAEGTGEVVASDLGFHAEPTVTGREFEVAFEREASPDGSHPLFPGPEIRIVLREGLRGDRIPEMGEVLSYAFRPDDEIPDEVVPLERLSPTDLRVVTYNVLFDSPWESDQEARFGRQLAAVRPDVVGFQEIWDHTPQQAAALVSRWTGEQLHATGNNDCIVVSRFPILRAFRLSGNVAVLLDAGETLGSELLVINIHLPCCGEDQARQDEADALIAFWRDAREGTWEIDPETPVVIMGDTNLVGSARPLETLITGDIADVVRFGPDTAPDWDGSDLTNLISRQTELRMDYTWRSDGGAYWPGHLDYVIYSDSVLEAVHHFLLYTPEMSDGNLRTYGLERSDSWASDHMLVSADFRLR